MEEVRHQRLRRINSELEQNISQFTSHLLASPVRASLDGCENVLSPISRRQYDYNGGLSTNHSPDEVRHAESSKIARAGIRTAEYELVPSDSRDDSSNRVAPQVLSDVFKLVCDGMESVSSDGITRCFTSEAAEPWNFLTRHTPTGGVPPILFPLWLSGLWFRYCVLLPLRVLMLASGIGVFCVVYPLISSLLRWVNAPAQFRKRVQQALLCWLASVFVASWGGYIRYHGISRPSRARHQIYVANHTSLIDVFILIKDFPFSCIGQRHSGIAGWLQDLLLSVQSHVWFDREEGRDRRVVHKLLLNHVENNNEPMLVFPEGTCVNNEYCVMFKKGSFELGEHVAVYPVAMRYDKRFSDAYWNSSAASFGRHLFELMTSWAVVCNVTYLPPQYIRAGESPAQFAARVKALICEEAQLININCDGFIKRHRISPRFLVQRQKAFSDVLLRRVRPNLLRSLSSANFKATEAASSSAVAPTKQIVPKESRRNGKASSSKPDSGKELSPLGRVESSKGEVKEAVRRKSLQPQESSSESSSARMVHRQRVVILSVVAIVTVIAVTARIMLPAARMLGLFDRASQALHTLAALRTIPKDNPVLLS